MTSIKHIKNISDHFLELEKRVRKVRFARIEASKRLRKQGTRYNTVISFYSILITTLAIVFSVVDLTDITPNLNIWVLDNYQKETMIILALSSFITMLTLFFSNRNYSERSAKYQSNYLELTRLLADIQNLIVYYNLQNHNEFESFKISWQRKNPKKDLEKRLAKKYKVFADKYSALLTQSENHETVDYNRACLDELEDEIKILERINLREDSLETETVDFTNDIDGKYQYTYSKNTLTSSLPKKAFCEPTAELNYLYRKESELKQEIKNQEWLDNIKYFFICSLPLILMYILSIFGGILESFH